MKKLLGSGIKVVIAIVVVAFLGLKSFDFFLFTTPTEQWYYAFFGFGLTSGGVIGYLCIFMWDADTKLKKTIALVMLVICMIGEVLTAGYGIQIEAWKQSGLTLAEADIKLMVLVIQLLGFVHALALVGYVAGDQIYYAFQDDDGDGIPNALDRHDNRKDHQPQKPVPTPTPKFAPALVPHNQDVPQQELKEPDSNPTNAGQA